VSDKADAEHKPSSPLSSVSPCTHSQAVTTTVSRRVRQNSAASLQRSSCNTWGWWNEKLFLR